MVGMIIYDTMMVYVGMFHVSHIILNVYEKMNKTQKAPLIERRQNVEGNLLIIQNSQYYKSPKVGKYNGDSLIYKTRSVYLVLILYF